VNGSKNIVPVSHGVRRKNLTFRMCASAQLYILPGWILASFSVTSEEPSVGKVNVVAAKYCPPCMGIEPIVAFGLLVVPESSTLQSYSFSPKNRLRRH
jgi:hypothetical protein